MAEIVHPGERHLQLNSALVSMVHLAFPGRKVTMICEETHAAAIHTYGDEHCRKTRFKTFISRNPGSILFWPAKILGEWRNMLRVIAVARKHKPQMIIWTALFPTGQWLLPWLSRLLLPHQQQYVLLQGELEYLNTHMQKPVQRVLRFLLRKGLQYATHRTKFIVLGHHIHDRMLQTGLLPSTRLRVLPHPFHYTPLKHTATIMPPDMWVAGTFGALHEQKNAHQIFRLASRMEREIKMGQISFHTAGKCSPAISKLQHNGGVTLHGSDGFMQQQALHTVIACFDLALFFYDDSAYTYCASGAIHEAIQMEIPVLTTRNQYATWLTHTYGDICLVFDDLTEMEQFIRALINGQHTSRLTEIKTNMQRFKRINSIDHQAQTLRACLQSAPI